MHALSNELSVDARTCFSLKFHSIFIFQNQFGFKKVKKTSINCLKYRGCLSGTC